MRKCRKMVRFAVPVRDDSRVGNGDRTSFLPERAVHTVNVGIWIGVAALLWSLLVIPALVI